MKDIKPAPGPVKFVNPKAEAMRVRTLYRDAALRGSVRRSASALRAMRSLVGPDCAYHLYRAFGYCRKAR